MNLTQKSMTTLIKKSVPQAIVMMCGEKNQYAVLAYQKSLFKK